MAIKSAQKRVIEIACKGAGAIKYTDLTPAQGDLKELSDEAFGLFKARILEDGFSEPISVWKFKKKNYVLNGHQRLETIRRMVENEGYKVAQLPVSFVKAKNMGEAKRKILSLTSQYGHIEEENLFDFMKENKIGLEFLREINLAEINTNQFINDFTAEVDAENPDIDLGDDIDPQLSHVKTVQLFFDVETAEMFSGMIDDIKEKFNLESITSAILLCVNKAYESRSK